MTTKVNLLIRKREHIPFLSVRSRLRTTILVLLTLCSLGGGSLYIYSYTLTKKTGDIDQSIAIAQKKVDSYKEIEQEKSLISLKVNELKQIVKERFDYVKAIDDVQKLFGYSLQIDSIAITPDGTVRVKAQKKQELKLPEEKILITNIKKLELALIVASSEELKGVIDNLKIFYGSGLSGAEVLSTTRLSDGGYEVNLLINIIPK